MVFIPSFISGTVLSCLIPKDLLGRHHFLKLLLIWFISLCPSPLVLIRAEREVFDQLPEPVCEPLVITDLAISSRISCSFRSTPPILLGVYLPAHPVRNKWISWHRFAMPHTCNNPKRIRHRASNNSIHPMLPVRLPVPGLIRARRAGALFGRPVISGPGAGRGAA